jgi:hypothetical protein
VARTTTSNYGAETYTQFAWATTDADFFDRELDLYNLARAVEIHDHSAAKGLAVARVANNTITTDNLQALAVTTAKIADLNVTTGKIADLAVTNAKLAVGAAVANLGATPVYTTGNSAKTGQLQVTYDSSGNVAIIGHNPHASGYTFGVYNAAASAYDVLWGHANATFVLPILGTSADFTGNVGAAEIDLDGSTSGYSLRTVGDVKVGANTGLQAQITALATVPSGAIVGFNTLALLTAAGAGWSRFTAADGKLLVGVGTSVSSQTFTEGNNYGTTWTPSANLSISAISAPEASNNFAASVGSPLDASLHTHTHPAPTLNNKSDVWLPPMRSVVWGLKS